MAAANSSSSYYDGFIFKTGIRSFEVYNSSTCPEDQDSSKGLTLREAIDALKQMQSKFLPKPKVYLNIGGAEPEAENVRELFGNVKADFFYKVTGVAVQKYLGLKSISVSPYGAISNEDL